MSEWIFFKSKIRKLHPWKWHVTSWLTKSRLGNSNAFLLYRHSCDLYVCLVGGWEDSGEDWPASSGVCQESCSKSSSLNILQLQVDFNVYGLFVTLSYIGQVTVTWYQGIHVITLRVICVFLGRWPHHLSIWSTDTDQQ